MLRIRKVQPFLCRPRLVIRANSTTAPPPPESEDQEQAEKLYNDKQARIFHAIMSNPVNKPYHGNKKLINQARSRTGTSTTTTNTTASSDGTEVVEGVVERKFKIKKTQNQVKHSKTALQLAQDELERENELKYYEVHEYKVSEFENHFEK